MKFRVLGPVEIRVGGRALDAGHARQRAVLAVLLLDLGRVIPTERLIDRVWGEDPPPAVRNALYGYIARLRATLATAADGGDDADSAGRSRDAATLSRHQGGYLLQADTDLLDLHQFRHLTRQAARAADDRAAEQLFRQALGLWRGPALTGVDSTWLNAMRDTLELERHATQLDLNDIGLRQGQHAALTAELAAQAAAAPADERLIGQLMLALYRSGRQADALRQFDQTRRHLADELGTDPAPQLAELHQRILRADQILAAAPPGAGSTPAAASRLGAASPPPTATTAAALVPRELPADVAAFAGRATELAALDEILLGGNGRAGHPTAAVISAVSGTAGVGKTALAVHWAHHAADRFPDGQLYVNLRGYDTDQPVTAADALAAFLRSLGVRGGSIPQDEAERAARYRSLLAGKQTLILLDNAATVGQVRPLLPGNPDCRVMVTSRDSLAGLVARDGAKRIDLDLLPFDDAVALLHGLIGSRVEADTHAAGLLAEQCARLPLALRVAAELATTRPNVPLADLADELSDQKRRLGRLEVGGDPRSTVRSVFSWSYRSLDADAARLFRLASLHPGPDFDALAAAALTGFTVGHISKPLATLRRAHLIQATAPGRLGMHDLLRVYACEQAAACDADDARGRALTRLFDYYQSAAAAAMDLLFPGEARHRPRVGPTAATMPDMRSDEEARAWLDSERANLVTVVVHCAGGAWPAHASGLAGTLFRYLMMGSHLPEARTIYSHALQAARLSGDPAAEATALAGLGGIGMKDGHIRDAARHFEAALDCYRSCGDRVGQARALGNLAATEHELGNFRSAVRYCREALAAFEDVGDSLGAARVLICLAAAETELGSYDQASEHLQRALSALRDGKHRVGEMDALWRLGALTARQGDLTRAADFYEQALAVGRRIDSPAGVAHGLAGLGEVSVRRNEYQQAIGYFRQALAQYRKAGDQIGEISALHGLAQALHGLGQSAAARAELTTALRLAAETGNTFEQALAHRDLAESHHAAGEAGDAWQHWQQAHALFGDLNAPEADEVRVRLGVPTADVESAASG